MPIPTGSAAIPTKITCPTTLEPSGIDTANEMTVIAAPLASHFSCWPRSPMARRQLSTWWPTNDSQITPIETTTSPSAALAAAPMR